MADPEIYDTFTDVGKELKLSVKSIYRLSRTDASFPVTRIGGSLRSPRSKRHRWLQQRTQGGT